MPTFKLRFPGGRYHATPWGHHVNEGLIEWPPSPWRLLRALLACGFATQGWTEVPPLMRQLVEKLTGSLPSFHLPQASAAHSRHYMPYLEGKNQKTTLVFDTWANVGDDHLLIHWPCQLSEEELHLLENLVRHLGYLGRSESWVEGEIVDDHSMDWNAVPCHNGEQRGRGWEQVSLIAAVPAAEYQTWQREQTEKALVQYPLPDGKKMPAKSLLNNRAKAIEPFPPDLIECLTRDTVWWKGHGWSQPPGSRRVLYWRRDEALQVAPPRISRPSRVRPVEAMLLAITSPSGNRSALPAVTRTLPQAELFHRAVVGRLGRENIASCPELTGKDAEGQPLKHAHLHAHTIPLDLDGDSHLDHILVWAPMGLGMHAQRAIRTLRRTWTKGGVGDLQLAIVGSGELNVLRKLPASLAARTWLLLGDVGGSEVWTSLTPFVAPRYLKRKGRDTLHGQINAELASRGFPEAESVDILPEATRQFRHYVKRRRKGSGPPAELGYALQLKFAVPIAGLIAMGYASHFGLGLFGADGEAERRQNNIDGLENSGEP